ncbi:MAG: hypothetical protein KAJ35_01320 [Thermoplasmata archaeon]|nr:hypothetical protein [Thermoplasmata archaeon]
MAPGVVGSTRILVPGIAILAGLMFSSTVSANPVSTPFDYTYEVFLFNLPLDGLLLLGMYVLFRLMGGNARPVGRHMHFIIFLTATVIIAASGALIDSVAFWVEEMDVYILSLALIASIATLCAMRYLEMGYLWSAITGVIFFLVNAMAWFTLGDPAFFYLISSDEATIYLVVYLAFLISLDLETFVFQESDTAPVWVHTKDDGRRPVRTPADLRWFYLRCAESMVIGAILVVIVIYSWEWVFSTYD